MPSFFAALALLALWLTALPAQAHPSSADKVTLLFLAVLGAIAWYPAIARRLAVNRNAVTWWLITVGVVLLQLANRAGRPQWLVLHPFFLPDDDFPISYATIALVAGALLGIKGWWKDLGSAWNFTAALVLLCALGGFSFLLLARHYPVGEAAVLDPTPLATLIMQSLSFLALALTCRAATSSEKVSLLLVRALPVALVALLVDYKMVHAGAEAAQ